MHTRTRTRMRTRTRTRVFLPRALSQVVVESLDPSGGAALSGMVGAGDVLLRASAVFGGEDRLWDVRAGDARRVQSALALRQGDVRMVLRRAARGCVRARACAGPRWSWRRPRPCSASASRGKATRRLRL